MSECTHTQFYFCCHVVMIVFGTRKHNPQMLTNSFLTKKNKKYLLVFFSLHEKSKVKSQTI